MIFRLYQYRLKCLFRNKENMFWCYMFPIILATCFFFAFNNIWSIETFKTIPIAYIANMEEDQLRIIIEEASVSDQIPMFSVIDCDEAKAAELLENNEIEAYIVGGSIPALYVKDNGMNETIIKSFLDNYLQRSESITLILQNNPNAIEEGLLEDVLQSSSYVEETGSDNKPNSILIYFYSLLAFSCIFASNWGLEEVSNIQANLSNRGARVNVSPIHKMKLFLCNMLAAFTIHAGSMVVFFLYLKYVIKVDFGNSIFYIFLTCLIGSLAGIATGAVVGVWVKKSAEIKEAVLLIITLGGAFLSGMMMADMKYIIADKIPFLGYISPVNLVTDALYSLYYYETYDRFYLNIGILCFITILLTVASYIGLRRKDYASL